MEMSLGLLFCLVGVFFPGNEMVGEKRPRPVQGWRRRLFSKHAE